MSLFDDASLVYIPTGYKATKNYSGKPSTGGADMTFSRASGATRVNSKGLVEKVRTNNLLQSNQFDTSWTNTNSTDTGGQTGYDGSSDAWLIEKTASDGRIAQLISTGGVQTASLYAKAGTLNWISFFCTSSSGNAYLYFDLANGVKGSTGANTIDSTITSVGGGWYRISITFDRTLSSYRIYPADGDGDVSGTSGNIYVQDAQLEYGSVATNYIETTSAAVSVGPVNDEPRLTYDPVNPTAPSLLMEPQRTNLLTYSEYYGTYSFFQSTLTSNNVVSPEGVQNGSTITITTQTTTQGMAGATITFDGTSNYTISGYYKKTTTSVKAQLKLRYAFASGTTYSLVDFNLNTGDITASLGENPSVVSFNSDWWYVSVTTSTPPVGTGRIIVRADNQPVSTEISFFGLQCEAGSYPTSYIPTYGAAVTRGADACSKTGIGSLIGQTEGTLYWEGKIIQLGEEGRVSLSDGTQDNRLWIRLQPSGSVLWYGRLNTINDFNIQSLSDYSIGDTIKVAATYAANDFKLYINGVEQGTDTTYSTSGITLNKLDYGRYNGNDPMMQLTKQLIVFPTALTPVELATLTTL